MVRIEELLKRGKKTRASLLADQPEFERGASGDT